MSGVPQGTVLGPLFFSSCINVISTDIDSEIRKVFLPYMDMAAILSCDLNYVCLFFCVFLCVFFFLCVCVCFFLITFSNTESVKFDHLSRLIPK